VTVIGRRSRTQPPPPGVVHEALVTPDRDPARPWLFLLDDEVPPRILETVAPTLVTWSSIWVKRPDVTVRFDLTSDGASGTDLLWTMSADDPVPDAALTGHLRYRLNRLINGDLRATFGQ
jgi:hypothetical protein